jgi:hypothetical protein
LSIISKNSERDAAGSAVAQAAVAQAQATANQAQQEAVSVASQAVSNSITAGQAALKSDSNNSGSTRTASSSSMQSDILQSAGQATIVMGPTTSNNNNASAQKQEQATTVVTTVTESRVNTTVETIQPMTISINESNKGVDTTTTTITNSSLPILLPQQFQMATSLPLPTPATGSTPQSTQEQSTQTQSIYSLLPPQQPLQVPTQQTSIIEVAQPQSNTTQQSTQTNTSETYAMLSPNLITDKSNPLTDIVEGKQNIPQNSTIATTGPSVNKNVGDNDVAGGVSINKMALAPVGYGDYLNLVLRDVAFYAPKEVYKNQRNVDNARALRQLSSDSKHKEMVEMQYAR